jgi:CDP-diacylglycerol--serine O-phosphatidyltransferase
MSVEQQDHNQPIPAELDKERANRLRGIYLIPNLFTLGCLFFGFYAIIAGMHGFFEHAAIAILIAIVMDGLDGRVARLLNSQSEFGAQLDSLADMVSFGVAPAMLFYTWSLAVLGKPGWLGAFVYTVCTALRLARFNTQLAAPDKRYFQGLSTTAAAFCSASLVWVATNYGISGPHVAWPLLCISVLLGLLKVSTLRYRSFKDIDVRKHVPFMVIVVVVMVLVLILFDPSDLLLLIALTYVLSGPVGGLWTWHKNRRSLRLETNTPSHHESKSKPGEQNEK